MHDLGTLGGSKSYGYDINNLDAVTGYAENSAGARHAFMYDSSMHDLQTLGGTYSEGYGINNSGLITGYAALSGNVQAHAFLYDTTMHDLGTLGGDVSSGFSINDSGVVVGDSQLAGDAIHHAFLYDGTMHDLGTLGGPNSTAQGINNLGQVVGYASPPNVNTVTAFVYDPVHGMVDLHTLLDPSAASQWILQNAWSINDAGQIVGIGTVKLAGPFGQFRFESHGYLMTPVPEPSSIVILGIGLAMLAFARRKALRLSRRGI